MSTTILICIGVGGGLLALLILAIVVTCVSNSKSAKSLQENITKYKNESDHFNDRDPSIILSPDLPEQAEDKTETIAAAQMQTAQSQAVQSGASQTQSSQTQTAQTEKKGPVIEPYTGNIPNFESPKVSPAYAKAQHKKDMLSRQQMGSAQGRRDDFEEFLDEHAYSRRILNKDILSKLKDLPPDVKAVLLSGLFNRTDD